ncbi:MAG: pantetheine-phosphate adenylyltransferase [Endomicrobiia bacterium]|nr:pantetheine-phosphate adenylyltransferase [Endomicrobiia bacterium]
MKNTAVYPGSFDPPTNGHLDVIARASRLFPRLIVAVTDNQNKTPTHTLEERLLMLRGITKNIPGVSVEIFSGLLVNYLKKKNARVIIRGLRAVSDFEYEFQLALMNRKLSPSIETVFLMPDEKYVYLSSSMVNEVARLGGSVDCFVPPLVRAQVIKKCRHSNP